MSIEQWSDLMFPEREGTVTPIYGSVRAINDDGSYEVQLNASSVTTRCAPCCTAMVGDRVLVLIKPNGKCDAIGRLGGEIGGGGTIVTQYDDVSNYIAGKVFAHAGTSDPAGALLCNGQAVSRLEYWELFDAIGTIFGEGDGYTTFNVPNIESRTIIGESSSFAFGTIGGEAAHTLTNAELPANTMISAPHVAGFYENYTNPTLETNADYSNEVQFTGHVGNQPHNNMQPYIVMRYFITTGKGDPVSGINPADYVVEWEANDSGWSWEKWASGKAKCWKTITLNATQSMPDGNLWYYGPFFPADTFPFEFVKPPSFTFEQMRDNGQGVGLVAAPIGTITTTGHPNGTVIGSAEGNYTFEFVLVFSGKWKSTSASGGTESIAPTIEERFEGVESGLDALAHAVESANVRLLDRFSGARSLTVTFEEDTSFRMPLILMGNGNAQIPVFSIIALQFANGDSTAQTSFKNMTDHGVAAVSISGFNVTITLDFDNWGNLYAFCPGGSFERIWGS